MSTEMVYRRFGRTELQMPVLSCGGMRYQHSWNDNEQGAITDDSQANLQAVIERSIELGITHIETARGYGTSEVQLGQILPQLPRDQMIVQTKVGPQLTRDQFMRMVDTSMANLKLDYVDLLGLHGVNNEEVLGRCLKKDGALDAAMDLREQGVVRHIGFSTHGPLDVIVGAIDTGAFDYVNLHWYYFDQLNAAAVDAATRQDMGVFIISPSDKGGQLYSPPQKLIELCAPLSPMAFNDLFCLANPQVHTLSVGASRPSDFDAHLEALPHLADPDAMLEPILERLEAALDEAVGEQWADNWDVNLPRYELVPGKVNLYHALRLYNMVKAYDMEDAAKSRYNLLGNGGNWFPGAKITDMDWEALPEAIKDSPVADEIPMRLREAEGLLAGEAQKRLSQS